MSASKLPVEFLHKSNGPATAVVKKAKPAAAHAGMPASGQSAPVAAVEKITNDDKVKLSTTSDPFSRRISKYLRSIQFLVSRISQDKEADTEEKSENKSKQMTAVLDTRYL